MANWKKVIVSGSNAHLNHITASGNISASGFLFGNLPASDLNQVVIYNSGSGRLEFKTLNLVSTERASRLALFERSNNGVNQTEFKLSYDTGSVISNVAPVILVSSSDNGGSTFSNSSLAYKGINDTYAISFPNTDNEVFWNPPTDNLSNIGDVREGVDAGDTSKDTVTINFQSVDNNNNGFPAYYNGSNLNFGARAFDRGGIGELRIYINTMDANNPTSTIDLTPGAAITTDNSNLTMALFATASNLGAGDAPDPTKHYRSGSMTIKTDAQTDGFNYAFALHTGSDNGTQFSYITNVFQWFYDTAGASVEMDFENEGTISNPTYSTTATHSVSGIRFFDETAADSTSLKYGFKVINQYRNIYPTDGGIQILNPTTNTIDKIEITQSGQFIDTSDSNVKQVDTSPSSTNTFNLVDLIANNANAHTNDTEVTASIGIQFDQITGDFHQPSTFISDFTTNNISNSANEIHFTGSFNSVTGHKNTTASHAPRLGDYMINTLPSSSAERNFEDFRGEDYRIQSRSYINADTSSISSYAWNSTKNIINGGAGFNKGAIQYYSHLMYPTGAGVGGTFNPSFGPLNNQPTYTTAGGATGEREYFRYWRCAALDNGASQVNIEIVGEGKIVKDAHTTYFGAGTNDAIKLQVWRSHTGGDSSLYGGTFLNALTDSISLGSDLLTADYVPIATSTSNLSYSGTAFTNTSGTTTPRGVILFSDTDGGVFKPNDFLITRIIVPQNWTGKIDAMAVRWGATDGVPALGSSGFTPL